MNRLLLALALVALAPGLAPALELKNVRSSYGPLGATRELLKVQPGDAVYITYDIADLKPDAKTGKVSYKINMELVDLAKKVAIYGREVPQEALPGLGGARMPGLVDFTISSKQAPGKYAVRVTVTDRNAKKTAAFNYPFEVVAPSYGFIQVLAPAIGFPDYPVNQYLASFGLVGMKLDSKGKPNVVVTIKVLDETGKPAIPPLYTVLPRDLPEGFDVKEKGYAPIHLPLQLNRPGRFRIDVAAEDRASKQTIRLGYTLHVLDIARISAKQP